MKGTLSIAMMAICSILTVASIQAEAGPRVIYGNDDRKDLYEVLNPLHKEWAKSTVVLVKNSDITQNSSGVLEINAGSFAERMGMCSTERFADQPSGGFCSGSLIGPNLVLTAGHCVNSMSECMRTSFVFDYAVNEQGVYPRQVAESAVYRCKNVLHTQRSSADFALIEVDREVEGRTPLPVARSRAQEEIANGTRLVMIGHPAGLPTKVDDGAQVRSASPSGFFVATTDSYGGNSGSAVFNFNTGEIEGVLVRGEDDYVYQNGCLVSNVCTEEGCRGEDVTKMSTILNYLQ